MLTRFATRATFKFVFWTQKNVSENLQKYFLCALRCCHVLLRTGNAHWGHNVASTMCPCICQGLGEVTSFCFLLCAGLLILSVRLRVDEDLRWWLRVDKGVGVGWIMGEGGVWNGDKGGMERGWGWCGWGGKVWCGLGGEDENWSQASFRGLTWFCHLRIHCRSQLRFDKQCARLWNASRMKLCELEFRYIRK